MESSLRSALETPRTGKVQKEEGGSGLKGPEFIDENHPLSWCNCGSGEIRNAQLHFSNGEVCKVINKTQFIHGHVPSPVAFL